MYKYLAIIALIIILAGCAVNKKDFIRYQTKVDSLCVYTGELNNVIQNTANELTLVKQKLDKIQTQMQNSGMDNSSSLTSKDNAHFFESIRNLQNQIDFINNQLKNSKSDGQTKIVTETGGETSSPTPDANTQNETVSNTSPVVETAENSVSSTQDPKEMYNQAKAAYDAKNYSESITLFQDFMNKYPKHDLAGNAQYWIGESYYSLEDYGQARKLFEKVTQVYSQNTKYIDSLYKIAMTYKKENKNDRALEYLKRIETEFPKYDKMSKVKAEIKLMQNK